MAKKKSSQSWWDKFNYEDDDYTHYGGDYYGGGTRYNYGYSKSYSRKSSGSTWSWGSYGGYNYLDEDDENIYVKAHESYLTPRDSDMIHKLDYQEDTVKNRQLIKEMARFFYHKMLEDPNYMDPKYEDSSSLTETQIQEYEGKKVYYKDLWDKYVPGVTPLEQALNIFREIQNKREATGVPKKQEVTTEELNRLLQDVEYHEELYCDPSFNELMKMQPLAEKHKMEIFKNLSMISHLGGEFKVQKETEERLVQNSSVISKKIMRDYSQIHNIDLYQRLMPTFPIKMITKDLIVNVCVDKSEHKQKIIILVDYSGSMNQDDKQIWVLAIMMDRLKYAMLEEAEIFFSYFVHETSALSFTHIYNRETALKFWAKFSTRPNGGDTRLGDMVQHIGDEISRGKLCNLNIDLSKETPEILAIND